MPPQQWCDFRERRPSRDLPEPSVWPGLLSVYARARAAGAVVVAEMAEADYGSRGFTVRDPEGNLWSFGTYRGA